jgi:hypothetical protein
MQVIVKAFALSTKGLNVYVSGVYAARDKEQETRSKTQGTRDKKQGANCQSKATSCEF